MHKGCIRPASSAPAGHPSPHNLALHLTVISGEGIEPDGGPLGGDIMEYVEDEGE